MLAIDCGNSRIKWARFEAGRMIDRGDASLLDDEDPIRVMHSALVPGIERVLIANVAGAAMAARLDAAVMEYMGVRPEFAAVAAHAHGIACGYRDPGTLGVDRWLAMIAARSRSAGPFAVVGAGTAVTFDAVDAQGQHLGGLILPGDRLMIEALAANTQQIGIVPRALHPASGAALFGRTTAEAVGNGTRSALAAAIDRAVDTLQQIIGETPRLIMTGGDAGELAGWLVTRAEIRADLVLTGLAVIAASQE